MHEPVVVTVDAVIDETPSIRTLVCDHTFSFKPGQFVMVWIPGVDEVPMALSSARSISVQRVGEATGALCSLEVGARIGLRGPLGQGFPTVGRILAIAGGIGAAPLLPLAAGGRATTFLLGARTASELPFREQLSRLTDLRVATDDGTAGLHGFVVSLLETVNLDDYDAVCVCGPEPMMVAARDRLESAGVLEKAFFSLHRHMKCGVGLCGSCAIDPDGLCVCRDGPVFPGPVTLRSEMGRHTRDASGRRFPFKRPG